MGIKNLPGVYKKGLIMVRGFTDWLIGSISRWLMKNTSSEPTFLSDFETICNDIKPGDVLLIDGKSRASQIIKKISQSAWSHATLYIGTLDEIKDARLRDIAEPYTKGSHMEQLIIETEIGLGAIISPISKYKHDHIRILRARRLTQEDCQKLIAYAMSRLGKKYSLRHLLDLARFLFPWGLWPRKWRSTLFEHNALKPTEDICSSMIADAFQSIHYPILPLVHKTKTGEWQFIRRNPRLFTPRDFDYSPYFDVIKYPIFPPHAKGNYQRILWEKDMISLDGISAVSLAKAPLNSTLSSIKQFFLSSEYAVVGASVNRSKYGNKVLRCYMQHQKKVWPVNPNQTRIEGLVVIHQITDLPPSVKSISMVTPPMVTEQIVKQAAAHGIQNIWMQPGAESLKAIETCDALGINVIADGACILMELGFNESREV